MMRFKNRAIRALSLERENKREAVQVAKYSACISINARDSFQI